MAQEVDPRELHRVVATCLIYRQKSGRVEFLIKQRDGRTPFPHRWETGAGGGLSPEELDAIPYGPDGQEDVGEAIVRAEVEQETGLSIGELLYLGTFRFVRSENIPVFGIRFAALALTDTVTLGDGARRYCWVTVDEAQHYKPIGSALDDMRGIAGMYKLAETEEVE